MRVESSLKSMLMIELSVIVVIGFGQYMLMRAFVNKIKRM